MEIADGHLFLRTGENRYTAIGEVTRMTWTRGEPDALRLPDGAVVPYAYTNTENHVRIDLAGGLWLTCRNGTVIRESHSHLRIVVDIADVLEAHGGLQSLLRSLRVGREEGNEDREGDVVLAPAAPVRRKIRVRR